MAQEQTFRFHIQMQAKDLWKFSMYHANKGYLLVFNVLFTLASLYLLVTKWGETGAAYRLLLLVCVMMFTVWQPGILFLKALKQAGNDRLKTAMDVVFDKKGFTVSQGEQSMEVAWDEVTKVVRIPGIYVLYMSSIRAYLISDQVLGGEKEAFTGFLRDVLPKERLKRV